MDIKFSISVVITCYSEGKLLKDAVESIHQQTLLPDEIILVNDAAIDKETNLVCRELATQPLIKVVWQEQNGGPSIARNHGFSVSQGEILVLLDADDVLPKHALERIQQKFSQYPEAGFVYGAYVRQDKAGQPAMQIMPGDISLKTMLSAKPFSLSSNWNLLGTTPVRRSLWQAVGQYDAEFGVKDLHDVDFWIRILASGCTYYAVPEPIYIWRKYLGSNSRQVTPLSWYQIAYKHLEVYRQIGLTHRAYELLLLGSKWKGDAIEINLYSQKLRQYIQKGYFGFSTLVTFVIPTVLFRVLAQYARQQR